MPIEMMTFVYIRSDLAIANGADRNHHVANNVEQGQTAELTCKLRRFVKIAWLSEAMRL